MQETSNSRHYLVALLLGIVGLLIILVFVSLRSQADQTSTQATISNATPEIVSGSIGVSDGSTTVTTSEATVNLSTESGTSTIYAFAEYRDYNGCSTVSSANGFIYHSTISNCGTNGSQNDLNCYMDGTAYTMPGATCTMNTAGLDACSGSSDTEGDIFCEFHVRSFADATNAGSQYANNNWVAGFTVTDSDSAITATTTATFELAELAALTINTSSMNFGSLALGQVSGTSTVIITNSGNDNTLGVTTDGNNWACTLGSFSSDYLRLSTSSPNTNFTNAFAMDTTAKNIGVSIAKQTTSGTASTLSSYWWLKIPASGDLGGVLASSTLSGTCSTTLDFVNT